MSLAQDDFDPLAVIVDWLDACRAGDLGDVLSFYDEEATFECRCESVSLTGRASLAAYWIAKLRTEHPAAFTLDDLTVTADGVWVDYQNNKGNPVRAHFRFNAVGRIEYANCGPVPQRMSA
jgi:ketosteroid isomerase-like protein